MVFERLDIVSIGQNEGKGEQVFVYVDMKLSDRNGW